MTICLELGMLTASVGRPEVPKRQEEIDCKWYTFFLSLLAPGSTWTFLKPWANQCIFHMEMFFLSYVNEAVYLLWNLPFFKSPKTKSFFFSQTLGWSWLNKPVFMSIVLWWGSGDDTPWAILSQKCILWEEGLVRLPQPWGVSLIWLAAH